MLRDWAYSRRITVTKKDVAAYAASDATRYFWIDKLEGQRILVPRKTSSRVKLWDINWEAVARWYPDLAPIVEDVLADLKGEEEKLRQEAREYLKKVAQAKPVEGSA